VEEIIGPLHHYQELCTAKSYREAQVDKKSPGCMHQYIRTLALLFGRQAVVRELTVQHDELFVSQAQ